MLIIGNVEVIEEKVGFGFKYTYLDGDNKITLNITELTIEEFYELSKETNDFEEYDLMKPYNVKTIAGYDWDIEFGKDTPNIWRIFQTMAKVGQRHSYIHWPDILYYRFEEKKMHKAYSKWIEEIGFELFYSNKIAMYYRERTDEIQEQNRRTIEKQIREISFNR